MATQPGQDAWLASADIVVPNHDDRVTLWEAVQKTASP